MNDALISAIVSYGVQYRKEYLGAYDSEALLRDWWRALEFFLAHACYQGRRDDISFRVYQTVVGVLQEYFASESCTVNYGCLREQGWLPIREQLAANIGKGKIGKARDVEMVVSTLAYIEQLPNLNIVAHSVGQIQQGLLERHYTQLQAAQSSTGIVQVGPKIAAFYLRDLVSLYALDEYASGDLAFFLQPVDVWVEKLAHKLEIVGEHADHTAIRKAIVDLCQAHRISAILFNQGAWYIGYHAFDLLLDKLKAESGN